MTESNDRAKRFATARDEARRVFESSEVANLWLIEPNVALGGVTPSHLLDSDLGLEQVLRALGAIEHGLPL